MNTVRILGGERSLLIFAAVALAFAGVIAAYPLLVGCGGRSAPPTTPPAGNVVISEQVVESHGRQMQPVDYEDDGHRRAPEDEEGEDEQ